MGIWIYFIDEHALEQLFTGFPTWTLLFAIAIAVILLSKGADWMIDGSVNLALRTNLSKIIIGATILSLGTTAPEAFVSVTAAFMGNPELALGNGVGSIIADTALIFGLTVLIATPPINRWILNRTGWWQIGSAVLLVIFAGIAITIRPSDPFISRWIGIIFVALLGVYLWMIWHWARSQNHSASQIKTGMEFKEIEDNVNLGMTLLMLLGGLIVILAASRLMIPIASETARRIGVPDDVIATTMLALGTSLPELTTALASIKKGHPEITVGNIIGADVLNVLFVIGTASLAAPLAIHSTFFLFHFPVMLLVLTSFRIFIIWNKNDRFHRWQGAYFLILYAAYVIFQYVAI